MFAPGRAAGVPRHGFEPQAQAAQLRFNHAEAVARPARSYRPATRTRRRYIAARDKAAPLNICRVALLLLQKRRGAAGLGELQWARGQKKYFVTATAHTQRTVRGAHSSKG
jgi:hypothetical protein